MPQTEPGENLNLVEENRRERADRVHRSSRFDAGSG